MDVDHYYYGYSTYKGRNVYNIPAFGNWDYDNDLPITQYFDCARQAGLTRFSSSSSSGDSDPRAASANNYNAHLYQAPPLPPPRKTRASRERETRCPAVKERKKGARICDVTQPPTAFRHVAKRQTTTDNTHKLNGNDPRPAGVKARAPKAVDEDLYKIPPELLHSSNRKKRFGFIWRCLVPTCWA